MHRYPDHEDAVRSVDGLLFPSITPSFKLEPGGRIFTIGSCFARNIEAVLEKDYTLPTADFSVPKSEWAFRPNGILNEYNPACISQRLKWAAEKADTSQFEGTMIGTEDSCIDLYLAGGNPVSRARVKERRREVDKVYAELSSCDLLVITLGLNECWYDSETDNYLNRNPGPQVIRKNPERYWFEKLDVKTSVNMMVNGIEAVIDSGVKNIVLTVSPVPLHTSFSGDDCVIANSNSKSTLRCVAEELRGHFKGVLDYFPSYEIVTSGGLAAFHEDHLHVREEVVEKAVDYLLRKYEASSQEVC